MRQTKESLLQVECGTRLHHYYKKGNGRVWGCNKNQTRMRYPEIIVSGLPK